MSIVWVVRSRGPCADCWKASVHDVQWLGYACGCGGCIYWVFGIWKLECYEERGMSLNGELVCRIDKDDYDDSLTSLWHVLVFGVSEPEAETSSIEILVLIVLDQLIPLPFLVLLNAVHFLQYCLQ